jgi:hypothetical protein
MFHFQSLTTMHIETFYENNVTLANKNGNLITIHHPIT